MAGPKRDNITINPIKNGELKVEGLENFKNSRGETTKTKKSMILCRCGASKAKPFCDSSHNAIGFADEKSEDRQTDQLDEYKGKSITILDNRGICSQLPVF